METSRFPQNYDPYCERCETLFESFEQADNHTCTNAPKGADDV